MKVGIIGAGNIGSALARLSGKAGHDVIISNSRGPETLTDLAAQLGASVSPGTVTEAADCDVVVLAVKWDDISSAGSALADWTERIVIDTSNAIGRGPDFAPPELGGRLTSEIVSAALPGARIVKTLNTWEPPLLEKDPHQAGGRRVQFVSGDHPQARAKVTELVESFGFAVIDLGDLAAGSRFQQFPGGVFPRLDLVLMPAEN